MPDNQDSIEIQATTETSSSMYKWQENIHKFQEKSGWCGPAVWQMAHIAGGDKVTSQEQIAKDIHYDESWGTTLTNMINYANEKFSDRGFKVNSKIEDMEKALNEGKFIIANFMAEDVIGTGGHYAVVTAIDKQNNTISMADPSTAPRKDGKKGVYQMNIDEFEKNWFDYATPEDEDNKVPTRGWFLWVDPLSIKVTKQVVQ